MKELKKRADSLYKHGNYLQALPSFNSILSIDPSNGEYFFKRAYSESMLSREKEAIKDYKKAAMYNYKREKAFLNLGIIYGGVFNDYDSATYYLDECLIINPNNIKAIQEKKKMQNLFSC